MDFIPNLTLINNEINPLNFYLAKDEMEVVKDLIDQRSFYFIFIF